MGERRGEVRGMGQRKLWLVLLVLTIVCSSAPLKAEGSDWFGTAILENVEVFLEKYGYLSASSNITGPGYFMKSNDAIEAALKFFQMFYGLFPSGIPDGETLNIMNGTRCGFPDIAPRNGWHNDSIPGTWNCSTGMVYVNGTWRLASDLKAGSNGNLVVNPTSSSSSSSSSGGQVANYEFFPGAPKWSKLNLSYYFANVSAHLSEADTKSAVRNAFVTWQEQSSFQFKEVDNADDANIVIRFSTRGHGDNSPFDGKYGVLAHGYSPATGWLHFDDDEDWVVNEGDARTGSFDLQSVAVHELGHVLGLGHTSETSAIMYPSIGSGRVKRVLQQDDINGIHSLYNTQAPVEGDVDTKCGICAGRPDGIYVTDSADCSEGCRCGGGSGRDALICANSYALAADGYCYNPSTNFSGGCVMNSVAREPPPVSSDKYLPYVSVISSSPPTSAAKLLMAWDRLFFLFMASVIMPIVASLNSVGI